MDYSPLTLVLIAIIIIIEFDGFVFSIQIEKTNQILLNLTQYTENTKLKGLLQLRGEGTPKFDPATPYPTTYHLTVLGCVFQGNSLGKYILNYNATHVASQIVQSQFLNNSLADGTIIQI